jgi:hypothetical protein
MAWAAGLFEGEGSIGAYSRAGRVSMNIMAQLVSTDEDVVRRFRAILGFGRVSGPIPRPERWKPIWTWRATRFEQVQALVAYFWDGLSVRRRDQARAALMAVHATRRDVEATRAFRMFGKREKDLNPEERRAWRAAVSKAYRERKVS